MGLENDPSQYSAIRVSPPPQLLNSTLAKLACQQTIRTLIAKYSLDDKKKWYQQDKLAVGKVMSSVSSITAQYALINDLFRHGSCSHT
jgi:hypothetical protein